MFLYIPLYNKQAKQFHFKFNYRVKQVYFNELKKNSTTKYIVALFYLALFHSVNLTPKTTTYNCYEFFPEVVFYTVIYFWLKDIS